MKQIFVRSFSAPWQRKLPELENKGTHGTGHRLFRGKLDCDSKLPAESTLRLCDAIIYLIQG
jgi:hypothetical protein